jgi:hypothetical protein
VRKGHSEINTMHDKSKVFPFLPLLKRITGQQKEKETPITLSYCIIESSGNALYMLLDLSTKNNQGLILYESFTVC